MLRGGRREGRSRTIRVLFLGKLSLLKKRPRTARKHSLVISHEPNGQAENWGLHKSRKKKQKKKQNRFNLTKNSSPAKEISSSRTIRRWGRKILSI